MEHAPPLTRGEKQLRAVLMTTITVIASATIVSVVITILFMYPFSPYRVDGLKIKPVTACPDEELGIDVLSQVEPGWKLSRIEVVSEWIDVDNPNRPPIPAGEGTVLEPPAHPLEWTSSDVGRFAPATPGNYRLHTEATTWGTFGSSNVFSGFPRSDTIEYDSSDVVSVIDSVCEGEE